MGDTVTSTADDRSAQAQPADVVQAGGSPRAFVWFFAVLVLVLGADLLIKESSFRLVADVPVDISTRTAADPNYIRDHYPHDPINLVPYVLSLQLTTNTGAVFGLGQGNRVLFVAVSLVTVVVVMWLFWHCPARAYAQQAAFALILAGALGNLYDRVIFSQVRDMFWLFPGLHLPFGLTWPGGETRLYPWIFNLADAALLVGIGVLVMISFRKSKPAQADHVS